MSTVCLFCGGKPKADISAQPGACDHCGGTGRGGLDRGVWRRSPQLIALLACLLLPQMIVIDLSNRPATGGFAFLLGLFLLPAILGFYWLLGRVIRDSLPLLLTAAAVLAAVWVLLDSLGVPHRLAFNAVGIVCVIATLPLLRRLLAPREGRGSALMRAALFGIAFAGLGLMVLLGRTAQAAFLAAVVAAVFVAHWVLGNIVVGGSRPRKTQP